MISVVDSEGFDKTERSKRSEALRGALCGTAQEPFLSFFFLRMLTIGYAMIFQELLAEGRFGRPAPYS